MKFKKSCCGRTTQNTLTIIYRNKKVQAKPIHYKLLWIILLPSPTVLDHNIKPIAFIRSPKDTKENNWWRVSQNEILLKSKFNPKMLKSIILNSSMWSLFNDFVKIIIIKNLITERYKQQISAFLSILSTILSTNNHFEISHAYTSKVPIAHNSPTCSESSREHNPSLPTYSSWPGAQHKMQITHDIWLCLAPKFEYVSSKIVKTPRGSMLGHG